MHSQRQRDSRDMLGPPPYLREVTWSGVHQRLKALWGSASNYCCVFCGASASEWAYDGTDPAQKIGPAGHLHCRVDSCWFSSWPEFYMPLCRCCHRNRDAAAASAELREYREWKSANPGLTLKGLHMDCRLSGGDPDGSKM
jgi:hypothetical protein